MVTLKDIAERAEVSIATVSRVVNNSGNVTESSQQKVIQAMKDLGYYSNNLARNLKNEKSQLISVIVPNVINPFFSEMLQGIDDVLSTNGFGMVVNNTDADIAVELECVRRMRSVGVVGNLVYYSHETTLEKVDAMSPVTPTVVLSGRRSGTALSDAIELPFDINQALSAAVEHLAQGGAETIWILDDNNRRRRSLERSRLDSLEREYGCVIQTVFISAVAQESYHVCKKLGVGKGRTGCVTANDMQAMGVVGYCVDAGISIPGDLELISFGDSFIAQSMTPAISSMGPSGYQIGSSGASFLLSAIMPEENSLRVRPAPDLLASELIRRATTR